MGAGSEGTEVVVEIEVDFEVEIEVEIEITGRVEADFEVDVDVVAGAAPPHAPFVPQLCPEAQAPHKFPIVQREVIFPQQTAFEV